MITLPSFGRDALNARRDLAYEGFVTAALHHMAITALIMLTLPALAARFLRHLAG